jgi:hypothetical protein
MNIPEALRAKLIAAGNTRLDIGNVRLELDTGKITRTITLDGMFVAEPEFATGEIDWDIVEKAVA